MAQISRKKLQVLTLPGYVLYFLKALYFDISIRIFRNLFICFVCDGLLQSICFRMFCFKHSITFDAYLLSCRFRCDIFYIYFRSCETFTITNSEAILLLIETLFNFRTMKCWFILYLKMYMVSANSNVFYICTVAIKNIKNMHAVSTNQIADILHFNNMVFKKLPKN